MTRLTSAALFGFFAVALGAFGAHVLRERLSASALSTYQTGVLYHLIHAAILVPIALQAQSRANLLWASRLFQTGILLFSGSLYVISLTEIRALGWITPVGGLALLGGWLALFVEGVRRRPRGRG